MGDNRLGVGDIVRTRRNDHRLGVHNGDMWQVESISRNEVRLKSPHSNKRAVVDPKYILNHTELGYASTLDSAQGITVNRAIVVVGDGMGNTGLYSATTRGRNAPIYLCLTDPDQEQQPAQVAAVERLRTAITTDDKAENALTYRNDRPPAEFAWQSPAPAAERQARIDAEAAQAKAAELAEFAAKRDAEIKRHYDQAVNDRTKRWAAPLPPPALAPSLTPDRRPPGGGGGPGR